MPQLKQPKDLVYLCYSSFSIFLAKLILRCSDQKPLSHICNSLKDSIPTSILEPLVTWTFQSGSLVIGALGQVQVEDDEDIFSRHCHYIQRCLLALPVGQLKRFETDYVIDMRAFNNFCNPRVVDEEEPMMTSLEDGLAVVATEKELAGLDEVQDLTDTLAENLRYVVGI